MTNEKLSPIDWLNQSARRIPKGLLERICWLAEIASVVSSLPVEVGLVADVDAELTKTVGTLNRRYDEQMTRGSKRYFATTILMYVANLRDLSRMQISEETKAPGRAELLGNIERCLSHAPFRVHPQWTPRSAAEALSGIYFLDKKGGALVEQILRAPPPD